MLLEDGSGIETRERFLGFEQVRAVRYERSKLFEGCRASEGETMIGERVAQGLDVDNALSGGLFFHCLLVKFVLERERRQAAHVRRIRALLEIKARRVGRQ